MESPGARAGPDDVALAKALSHPLRFRLLQRYSERIASPSELAKVTGARLGDVTYHTRVLRELGCIELVRTRKRRGATEHFYRAAVRAWLPGVQAPATAGARLEEIAGGVARDIWADLEAAAAGGNLGQPDVHVSRTLLQLDEEAWAELSRRLDELLDVALRLEAESAARGDGTVAAPPSELALLHFARAARGELT